MIMRSIYIIIYNYRFHFQVEECGAQAKCNLWRYRARMCGQDCNIYCKVMYIASIENMVWAALRQTYISLELRV